MSKTHLDLRCRRRLTVAEGRTILAALDSAGVANVRLKAKIDEAIALATHKCDKRGPRGLCSVCNNFASSVKRIREMRAEDFKKAIASGKEWEQKERARRREESLRSPPPNLTLTP